MIRLVGFIMCIILSLCYIMESSAQIKPFAGQLIFRKSIDTSAVSSTKFVTSECVCRMICLVQPKCTGVSWRSTDTKIECNFSEFDTVGLVDDESWTTFVRETTTTTLGSGATYYYSTRSTNNGGDYTTLNNICSEDRTQGILAILLNDADRADLKTQLGVFKSFVGSTGDLWTGLKWISGTFSYHTGITIIPDTDIILFHALKELDKYPNNTSLCMVMKDSSNFHPRECLGENRNVLCMEP